MTNSRPSAHERRILDLVMRLHQRRELPPGPLRRAASALAGADREAVNRYRVSSGEDRWLSELAVDAPRFVVSWDVAQLVWSVQRAGEELPVGLHPRREQAIRAACALCGRAGGGAVEIRHRDGQQERRGVRPFAGTSWGCSGFELDGAASAPPFAELLG